MAPGLTERQKAALKKAHYSQRSTLLAQYKKQAVDNAKGSWKPPAKPPGVKKLPPVSGPPRNQNKSTTKPKAKGKSRPAGRPGDVFNPMHPGVVPSLLSDGKSLPVKGLVRNELTLPPIAGGGFPLMLICTNNGVSGCTTAEVHIKPTPVISVSSIKTLDVDASNGGPTTGRAMKVSLGLSNSTQHMIRGGRIYVSNIDQRLSFPVAPSLMTEAQWLALGVKLSEEPNTIAREGEEFGTNQHYVAHPVNQTSYANFLNWKRYADYNSGVTSAHDPDGWFSHIAVWPAIVDTFRERPMSTIVFFFEVPASLQTYTATARATYFTRWPLNTISGQNMKNQPTADSASIVAAQNAAEAAAVIAKNTAAAALLASTAGGKVVT
jgi:hypothetical protein